MSSWRGCALGLAALVGLVLPEIDQAHATQPDRVVRVSNKTFDHVIQQLKWRFGGYGITVVNALDYQQILKKMEIDSKKGVIYEILRPQWVETIFEHAPQVGFQIPLRVYVYEKADGKTAVSYYKASMLFDSENDALEEFWQGLDQKIEAIVRASTR